MMYTYQKVTIQLPTNTTHTGTLKLGVDIICYYNYVVMINSYHIMPKNITHVRYLGIILKAFITMIQV